MSKKANYFKVGLFVLVSVAIGIIIVIILGAGALFEDKIIVETYIDQSVQGLDIGSPVKHRGVQIGKVEEITFVGKEYDLSPEDNEFYKYGQIVLVRFAISLNAFGGTNDIDFGPILDGAIKSGLRARLAAAGITGIAYLEADYVAPPDDVPMKIVWEPEHHYIPSYPSTLFRMTEAANKILEKMEEVNLREITGNLNKALETLTKSIEDIHVAELSEQANNFISELRDTNRKVVEILEGPAGNLLEDTSLAIASVRRIAENSEGPIADIIAEDIPEVAGNVNKIMADLGSLSEEVTQTIDQLQKILRRMEKIVVGEQQDIEDIIENLRVISDNFREFTENSKKFPSQVIFGEPPAPRELPEK